MWILIDGDEKLFLYNDDVNWNLEGVMSVSL
jgi:hypothetical protein